MAEPQPKPSRKRKRGADEGADHDEEEKRAVDVAELPQFRTILEMLQMTNRGRTDFQIGVQVCIPNAKQAKLMQ